MKPKCKHCGRHYGEHQATRLLCPIKLSTAGNHQFNPNQAYEPVAEPPPTPHPMREREKE